MYVCVHDHNNISISSPCINAQVFAMVLPNRSRLYIDVKVGEVVCLGMKSALNNFAMFCCLLQRGALWSLEDPSQIRSVLLHGGICHRGSKIHLISLPGSTSLATQLTGQTDQFGRLLTRSKWDVFPLYR